MMTTIPMPAPDSDDLGPVVQRGPFFSERTFSEQCQFVTATCLVILVALIIASGVVGLISLAASS